MPDNPDSAIERATRAAEAKLLHIEARDGAFYEHAEDVAKACLAAAYPEQTEGERWWITTDLLARGGKKIIGPFESKQLAFDVRYYVELSKDGRETFFVESEPQSESAPSGDRPPDTPEIREQIINGLIADCREADQALAEGKTRPMSEILAEMSQPVDEVEAEAIYWHREYEKVRASLVAAEQKCRKVENSYIELANKLRAAEADRDRLEQEIIELHDRFNQDSDRIWTLEGDRDRLQRELDHPERDKSIRIALDQTRRERDAFRADLTLRQQELNALKGPGRTERGN